MRIGIQDGEESDIGFFGMNSGFPQSWKVMEKFVVMESHGKVTENNKYVKSHGKVKILP